MMTEYWTATIADLFINYSILNILVSVIFLLIYSTV